MSEVDGLTDEKTTPMQKVARVDPRQSVLELPEHQVRVWKADVFLDGEDLAPLDVDS